MYVCELKDFFYIEEEREKRRRERENLCLSVSIRVRQAVNIRNGNFLLIKKKSLNVYTDRKIKVVLTHCEKCAAA